MASESNRMTRTGFCAHPSPGSHVWCRDSGLTCSCPCHSDADAAVELDTQADALAAGYTAESDIIPAGESGKGQGA